MGIGLVCLSIAGMVGGVVPAVESGTTESASVPAEAAQLDPVVVTGTQVAVPVSQLPAAVTVIDRQEIESAR